MLTQLKPTANSATTMDTHSADPSSNPTHPHTVVLQPQALSGIDGTHFRSSFDTALRQADAVIVDLIWVDDITQDDLGILLEALQQATRENKPLSFLSMDATTRASIDQLWERNRAGEIENRYGVFTPDFERFLENHHNQPGTPYCASMF
jgi:hypothetical protein